MLNDTTLLPVFVVRSSGSRVRRPTRTTLLITRLSYSYFFDFENAVTDHVVTDSHQTVELLRDLGVRLEVHDHVVAFFVAVDLVGELALVPLGCVLDAAALGLDDALKAVGDLLDVLIAQLWGDDVKGFVLAIS